MLAKQRSRERAPEMKASDRLWLKEVQFEADPRIKGLALHMSTR